MNVSSTVLDAVCRSGFGGESKGTESLREIDIRDSQVTLTTMSISVIRVSYVVAEVGVRGLVGKWR